MWKEKKKRDTLNETFAFLIMKNWIRNAIAQTPFIAKLAFRLSISFKKALKSFKVISELRTRIVEFEDILVTTLTFKNIKFHKSSIRSVKDKNYLQHVLRFHSNSMLQTNSYLK